MRPPTDTMVTLNIRVPQHVRDRFELIADVISERDLNRLNVSDAARMAIGRGLPVLEAELGIGLGE